MLFIINQCIIFTIKSSYYIWHHQTNYCRFIYFSLTELFISNRLSYKKLRYFKCHLKFPFISGRSLQIFGEKIYSFAIFVISLFQISFRDNLIIIYYEFYKFFIWLRMQKMYVFIDYAQTSVQYNNVITLILINSKWNSSGSTLFYISSVVAFVFLLRLFLNVRTVHNDS